eukprot:scaffold641912_cov15-Prasinocladus_malaysianus.AAC.1
MFQQRNNLNKEVDRMKNIRDEEDAEKCHKGLKFTHRRLWQLQLGTKFKLTSVHRLSLQQCPQA